MAREAATDRLASRLRGARKTAAIALFAWAFLGCAPVDGSDDSVMTPPCMDGRHDVVGGFVLARNPDYVADYAYGQFVSSTGTPCAGVDAGAVPAVTAEARCQLALESAQQTAVSSGQRP